MRDTPMNCTEFETQLLEHQEHNRQPGEALAKHLVNCESCSAFHEKVMLMNKNIFNEKNESIHPFLFEKINNKIHHRKKKEIRFYPKAMLRLAVVLLLAVGTGLLLNNFLNAGIAEQEEINAGTSIQNSPEDDLIGNNSILSLNE